MFTSILAATEVDLGIYMPLDVVIVSLVVGLACVALGGFGVFLLGRDVGRKQGREQLQHDVVGQWWSETAQNMREQGRTVEAEMAEREARSV